MPKPFSASIDVLILTPIAIEFEAIRTFLKNTRFFTDHLFTRSYCVGNLQQGSHSISIALRETKSGHLPTAKAVQEGMQLFKPQLLVLFGTAGGLRKVKIGDIIVATVGCSYESGKVVDDSFYSNIKVLSTHQRVIEKASILAKQPALWKSQNSPAIAEKTAVHFGPILSGDKVLASDQAPLRQLLRERYYDALGLEMEAYAFLDVAQSYPDTETLIVRGVSDLLGDKTEANLLGSKALAVTNAAAFLHALLLQDDVLLAPSPHRISRKRIAMLLGLVAILSVFSLFWIKSPRVDALTATTPFSIDTVLNEEIPSTNNEEIKKTPTPAHETAIAAKKTIQTEITKSAPSEESRQPVTLQSTIPSVADDPRVNNSNTTSYQPPVSFSNVDSLSKVVSENRVDLPTFIFKIYVEDQNGKTIRGANYIIDGKPIQLVRNKVRLTAGEHQLEIHYSNYEPIKTLINVPSLDNEQTIQKLFLQ